MDILIIEQNEAYMEFLKNYLGSLGKLDLCYTFASGMSKIDQFFLSGRLYNLYFIDLSLPDTSAIRLLSKIRSMEESLGLDTSFIVLMAESRFDSRALGFFSRKNDVFIEKTMDEDILKNYFTKLGILHN